MHFVFAHCAAGEQSGEAASPMGSGAYHALHKLAVLSHGHFRQPVLAGATHRVQVNFGAPHSLEACLKSCLHTLASQTQPASH